MNVNVMIGDALALPADVLISPANPWLSLSGGVNGAILASGGAAIQAELRDYLASAGRKCVEPGTVVRTSAGPLPFRHILHAVAIDPFYDSSEQLVRNTLESAFEAARGLGVQTLMMPTLATGYGHLGMSSFAEAFAAAIRSDWSPLTDLRLVVRSEENAAIIRRSLSSEKAMQEW